MRDAGPITLDEWRKAAAAFPSFHITDKVKQQNPFTGQFVDFPIEGSGYWECRTLTGPVWSGDNVVWFRFAAGRIFFIQFPNLQDPELMALAKLLRARLEHYEI